MASRAEARFGLGRYAEARDVIARASMRPEPWHLQTFVEQLGTLARLREPKPLSNPDIHAVFEALLAGASQAVRSAVAGKVGLALSGGGFRASFYHLGVLARLAELDALRHIEVLSCVSGGSIVGASYWLALRARMLEPKPMQREDYVRIVRDVIERFEKAVATNLHEAIQPSKVHAVWRLLRNNKGVLNPEDAAAQLQKHFYGPLMSDRPSLYMHELHFTPADHDPALAGPGDFHPTRHNWVRAHKVPALVLNATTVNTAHAWQFTTTWMGESPGRFTKRRTAFRGSSGRVTNPTRAGKSSLPAPSPRPRACQASSLLCSSKVRIQGLTCSSSTAACTTIRAPFRCWP